VSGLNTPELRAAAAFVDRCAPRQAPFWFEQAYAADEPLPPLDGAVTADVCVVGGGYVGLWTAIRVKALEPAARVVVLEADRCGRAASGRNGGLALSWWMKGPTLAKRLGRATAVDVARQSADAVDELVDVCAREGIDAGLGRDGYIYAATSPGQLGAWDAARELAESAGEGGQLRPIDAAEIERRMGCTAYLEGVHEARAVNLQPALLADGLRRLALRRGVEVFEHSRVMRLDHAAGRATVARGHVDAGAFVLATNAWLAQARGIGRTILPLGSYLCVTEPVPELLDELGWAGREGINGMAMMEGGVDRTHDGRVKFSYRAGTLSFHGAIPRAFDYDRESTIRAVANLHRVFPALAEARVTHAWGGAVDRSTDGLPWCGSIPAKVSTVYAAGLSGNGVAPALLVSRILASSALRRGDEWQRHPLNSNVAPGRFPPEPARYVGGKLVRRAVRHRDEAEAANRAPSLVTRRLASLAPPGFR
jgi:glycine/D-amino acid oxidase-like deaminating enzyme